MRIVQVTPLYSPSPGGAERHVQEVSERLAARGHAVTVLTTNAGTHRDLLAGGSAGLPARERLREVEVVRVDPADDWLYAALQGWLRLKGGYRSLCALLGREGLDLLLTKRPRNRHLLAALLATRAEVVLSWNWVLAPAYHAELARRLRRFRLIGVPLFHTEERWARRPIYDGMLRACEGLIVNTAHEAEFIRSRHPGADRIAVIGPGVAPEHFRRPDAAGFRRRHGLGGKPLVGFVGRLCAEKGVPALLEAMRLVWASDPEVRLVLAGYRSFGAEPPETLLAALTPAERERVLFLLDFPDAEKPNLYAALEVFVMPSVAESFGIAYLEAWMCGKPVIGSRVGATSRVIEDGLDGLTVDPRNPADIAHAIHDLLRDPVRRLRMGERGRAKTLANFTWDEVTSRVEAFCADPKAVGRPAAPAEGRKHPGVAGRLGRQPLGKAGIPG